MTILYWATVGDKSPTHHSVITDLDIIELYDHLVHLQFEGLKPPKILMHRPLSSKEEVSFLLHHASIGEYNHTQIINESSMKELRRVYSFSEAKCERCTELTPHLQGLCHSCNVTKRDYILGVAIVLNDKIHKLPKPNRHSDLIHKIRAEGICGLISQKNQGFYSGSGEFISREEARALVVESGQCKNPDHPDLLFSEDLW